MIDIEFVTASHDDVVLHGQLKRSPIFQKYSLTEKKGFSNIPAAYNSLGPIADLTCYLHHDVFLPPSFEMDLKKSLERLPGDWGVIGVAGVKLVNGNKLGRGYILDRGQAWGSPWKLPAEVDTLDEMLLITHSDLVFDEQFPLDFYGADICMQARAQGRKCYAINAYCQHNSSRKFGERTPSFFESQEKFKQKWKEYLPIGTTCAIVH